jgi:hypothetical protein
LEEKKPLQLMDPNSTVKSAVREVTGEHSNMKALVQLRAKLALRKQGTAADNELRD